MAEDKNTEKRVDILETKFEMFICGSEVNRTKTFHYYFTTFSP